MSRVVHLPAWDELLSAPELAAVTLLDTAASVASLALGAAYPEMATLDFFDDPDELAVAVQLINALGELNELIRRYRRTLARARNRQLDLPF